jgi:hypothetical protein
MMGEDVIQSGDLTGKRCTKKVTPTEGAISWDTVADAGEVDQDEEDQDNPNRGLANKNVSIFKILELIISEINALLNDCRNIIH